MTGCDFCGIIVDSGPDAAADGFIKPGTRVCGAVFPYGAPDDMGEELRSGAFSQWVVADTRLLLRVPDSWSDTEGAALGGVGWGTVGLAVSDPNALGLEGTPSRPAKVVDDKTGDREPVLIYGGATATGTMACQLLKLLVLFIQALSPPFTLLTASPSNTKPLPTMPDLGTPRSLLPHPGPNPWLCNTEPRR